MTKPLIFTQKLDKKDQTLGFFVEWVRRLSVSFEKISVVCLEKGQFDLPENVFVYSLGNEKGRSRLSRAIYFYKYLFNLRDQYGAVFVHMNEEYVLLGGIFWKLMGVPVFLWRNHPKGSFRTYLAVWLSKKVFCTAKDSFTARFKKTALMPVGIDTKLFREDKNVARIKNSACMVGRISPIKKIELCLQAVLILINQGIQISLTILGPCQKKDINYLNFLKDFVLKNNLSPYVKFFGGVEMAELPKIYSSREILVNLTESGSFDKTIAEACACGAAPLVSNKSLFEILPKVCATENDPAKIAKSLQTLLQPETRMKAEKELKNFAEKNSLDNLMEKLTKEIKNGKILA